MAHSRNYGIPRRRDEFQVRWRWPQIDRTLIVPFVCGALGIAILTYAVALTVTP